MYTSTPETTNANRASRVLLGPCSDQLRDVLCHFVPLSNFQTVIRLHRTKLPRLTQPQKDLILPKRGFYTGNYSDMDISLLYTLLRNICSITPHNKGWGNDPDLGDNSLSANIERIRSLRNKVGHSSSSLLSKADFNDIWSAIKAAVVDIDTFLNNGKKYEMAVDYLEKETMDPEMADNYEERLREQVKEDTETRKLVAEHDESLQMLEKSVLDIKEQQAKLPANMTGKIDQVVADTQRHNKEICEMKEKIDHSQSFTAQRQWIKCILWLPSLMISLICWTLSLIGLSWLVELIQDSRLGVYNLKQRLFEINYLETRKIPLAPLQEGGDKLPIEQLFSSVVIKDSKETGRVTKSMKEGKKQKLKEVKSPDDMFSRNGKPVRRVFMLGDAAHGKTTYCMWLLKNWCNAQQPSLIGRPLNEWENALKQFDFVFQLPLRYVDPSRANVMEMICQDVLGTDLILQTAAKHVLSSDKFRCFIILDGLDEWKPNPCAIDQLRYKGMPNIDNMSNCIIFTTMRPWMFEAVAGLVRDNDRVIEILGLDDKGIIDVIEKVLIHYYKMDTETDEYVAKKGEIISYLKDETLKSFIKIPLLAVVCVQIWYEGEQVGDSMTSFYTAMVNMLIERAHLKYKTQNLLDDTIKIALPKLLSVKKNIKQNIQILLKLGKVAYEGLLSKQIKLVFQKDDLETEIGKEELQFALDVGLISQNEARSVFEKNVSVHFFHKSVQEFLAVVHILTQEEVKDSFCEHLSDVNVIMELSNVIMFICGMCPFFGSDISKCVVNVTDSDKEICQYREAFNYISKVRVLYTMQLSWYRELQYGQTDSPVTLHISDVYAWYFSEFETVTETSKLLSDDHVNIRSLWLWRIKTNEKEGITNEKLNDFLSDTHRTRSLVMLYVDGSTGRCLNTICVPTLKTLGLKGVRIQDKDHYTTVERRPFLRNLPALQRLLLSNVIMEGRDLGGSQDFACILKVELNKVKITTAAIEKFILALKDIFHRLDVILNHTPISRDTVTTIRSSPHFLLSKNSVNKIGRYELEFTRIWPETPI